MTSSKPGVRESCSGAALLAVRCLTPANDTASGHEDEGPVEGAAVKAQGESPHEPRASLQGEPKTQGGQGGPAKRAHDRSRAASLSDSINTRCLRECLQSWQLASLVPYKLTVVCTPLGTLKPLGYCQPRSEPLAALPLQIAYACHDSAGRCGGNCVFPMNS